MARMRSVKPEFWGDRKLARLVSRDARLLYIALWNQADEHARLQGDARWVKGQCLPYDDDLNLQAIDSLIDELVTAKRVVRYEVDGDPYLFLPKLAAHQRLEPTKVPSRHPDPPETAGQDTETWPSESDPDEVARRADSPETIAAKHVAGSREHVASGRGHVAPRRDATWDALLDACGVDEITDSARGAYNRATKDLRSLNAEPVEIRRRAAVFRQRWPTASLTPTALVRRWGECANIPTPISTGDQRAAATLALAHRIGSERKGIAQ